ncbi:MAG: Hpt domain-containing protein [Gammaproteobacteria bacterium]|nr:Hpt domain-containing protein [Gammaproteobacteria bacterium]
MWVKSEIDETLDQARKALEAYIEDEADSSQIQFCLNYVHQVRGTLQMVELYGAAMAAEEMENLIQAIISGKLTNKNDAYEVLIRGVLQLPDYLEHLREGYPDTPMLLMPLLNDLRAARGAALLSENALFSPDLSINAPLPDSIQGDISKLLRKMRYHYQSGLLGWFRNQNRDSSLQKMAVVIEKLRAVASEQEINRLLWVASGLVESLMHGGLDSSVSVKLLLGQLDRQFKLIIDRGEHALNIDPPSDLLKNLLYYVATSRSDGERTSELKKAFSLDKILPDVQTLEQARADMAAPNMALMGTVSAVLIEDLLRVKDNLDLFVRAEERNAVELVPLIDTLSQMADTLGMLGLGIERESVQSLISIMSNIHDGTQTVDDNILMKMAGLLLELENALKEASSARAANVDAEKGKKEVAFDRMHGVEQQKLLKTVIDEAKLELEQIKSAINIFSKNPADNSILETVPSALDRIKGGISILNLDRAADLLNGCILYIRHSLLEKTIIPNTESLDHLADAISSVEYYLESLAGEWGQPDAILDVAEHSLRQLQADGSNEVNDDLVTLSELKQPHIPTDEYIEHDVDDTLVDLNFSEEDYNNGLAEETLSRPVVDETEPTLTLDIEGFDSRDDAEPDTEETVSAQDTENEQTLTLEIEGFETENDKAINEETIQSAELVETQNDFNDTSSGELTLTSLYDLNIADNDILSEPDYKGKDASSPAIDEVDNEIIEIFLEEAEEELQRINENVPEWKQDRGNETNLKEIRRSFHTLKGSGRLVGAFDIGEFAWAFENMLNRVLEHAIEPSDMVFCLLDNSLTVLPKLIELFIKGETAGPDALGIIEKANILTNGGIIPLDDETLEDKHSINEIEISDNDFPELLIPEKVEEAVSINDHVVKIDNGLPEIDAVLLDIYRKEVDTHLDTLDQYCSGWNENVDRTANQALIRALHTLKGSSRTTGIKQIADLCGQFEHYMNEVQSHNRIVPSEAVSLLQDSATYIHTIMSAFDEPGIVINSNEVFLHKLDNLLENILSLEKIDLNNEVANNQALSKENNDYRIIEPNLEPETVYDDIDYDDDLLEIFIEEGEEILNATDTTLHHWRTNPDNHDDIELMQRYLHTLKGGARMSGVMSIGDLSHQIESMLTEIADGRREVSENIFTALERSQDHLVKMLEQLKAHTALSPIKDIMREVEELLSSSVTAQENDNKETQQPASEIEPELEIGHESKETEIQDDAGLDNVELLIGEQESAGIVDSAIIEELESLAGEIEKIQGADRTDEDVRDVVSNNDSLVTVKPASIEGDTRTEPSVLTEMEDSGEPENKSDKRNASRTQEDHIRVKADLLDSLVNFAGEVSIYRARMEQQTNSFSTNLSELDDTVARLRAQLRQFEIETETQIQFRQEETASKSHEEFDPLEFDRFTHMQHLSRGMLESLSDLDSLRNILANINRESETLLLQQSRVNTELQEGLMRTRLVPFSGQAPKLRRIIRKTSDELGKKVELHLAGLESELDRTVMDKIIPSLEHMLRNAVAHGIESPGQRMAAGKHQQGNVYLSFNREGADIIITISDDGNGINIEAIRKKAVARGMLRANAVVNDDILLNMIMEAGFSTAEEITQIAGRGVGLDVVNAAIKQLGGIIDIKTEQGRGTTFTITLPLTLAISRALMVNAGDENFAIPLLSVQGVERISAEDILAILENEHPVYDWLGEEYKVMSLAQIIGLQQTVILPEGKKLPLLMFSSGEYHAAIQVDALLGSREVVIKPVGPQLSALQGVSGATIMGDGSVMLILDLGSLVRQTLSKELRSVIAEEVVSARPTIMIVDDSITVRKVTSRLLERHDYLVMTAKDGVDALSQLHEIQPDVVLLDVEMPRMDGFELATNMRNDDVLKSIPIIMITSRTGEKHRERAMNIGVNMYMGKPFNEDELLKNIRTFVD